MSNLWCDKHWKPYSTGKLNGILASIRLQGALLENKPFQEMCGHDADPEVLNKSLEKIIEKHGAVCCYLGEALLESILAEVRAAKPS